jgi:ElaB/YqjD/DUF883 family membrane-anchored ribosome-binding protein
MFSSTTKTAANETEDNARKTAHAAERTIKNGKIDLEDAANSSIGDVISDLADNASDVANKYGKKARRVYDDVAEQASDHTDALIKEVKRNPMRSIALAALAGYILSAITRRSSK